MPRFFVVESNIKDDMIRISGGDAAHITTVLRGKNGDIITACDKAGAQYTCIIVEATVKSVLLRIIESEAVDTEPSVRVTLFQALPKADKMEFIIQKCVELGVYEITPVVTERTIVKLNEKTGARIDRFNLISESAAKQSGRGIIPRVNYPIFFQQAIAVMEKLDIAFAAYEKERDTGIKQIAGGFSGSTAGILIGPEGGFTDAEITLCQRHGIRTASLGKRILRAETAGFTALTIFLYEMEEF